MVIEAIKITSKSINNKQVLVIVIIITIMMITAIIMKKSLLILDVMYVFYSNAFRFFYVLFICTTT